MSINLTSDLVYKVFELRNVENEKWEDVYKDLNLPEPERKTKTEPHKLLTNKWWLIKQNLVDEWKELYGETPSFL